LIDIDTVAENSSMSCRENTNNCSQTITTF